MAVKLEQLFDGKSGGDEREAGADPGQQGSLVGEREAGIEVLADAYRG
jgi:hypothetical protein